MDGSCSGLSNLVFDPNWTHIYCLTIVPAGNLNCGVNSKIVLAESETHG